MAHSFSMEILYHFLCGHCKKWWTIGDWKVFDAITCPHCGVYSNAIGIKEGENNAKMPNT